MPIVIDEATNEAVAAPDGDDQATNPHALRDDIFTRATGPNIVNGTQQIRRAVIGLLQAYFARNKPGEDLVWRPEERTTDIFIADAYPEGNQAEDLRPAIITERSTVQRTTVGVGNDLTEVNLLHDRQSYMWLLGVNLTLHCVSRYALQAEDIAWTVHDVVLLYADQMAAKIGLSHIGDSAISNTTPYRAGQTDDWQNTPVSFAFFLNRSYTVQATGYSKIREARVEVAPA